MMPCQGARVMPRAVASAGPPVDSTTVPPGSGQVTGRSEKIDAILSLVQKYGIREMVRTGQVTLVRGTQPT